MRVSRNLSIAVQYVLDQWIPPVMRDSRWFMYLPLKLVLKETTPDFMTFKNWVFTASEDQFGDLYRRTEGVQSLQGETDLNAACLERILDLVKGKSVLDVGCGRGYLAKRLAETNTVTACDIAIAPALLNSPEVTWTPANIEQLPFDDATFDIVVSTHALEHVIDLRKAIAELRRVAKSEVIIVVPRQRPYRYTFSLHTQFFPYEWSLRAGFGPSNGPVEIQNLGDWLYRESLAADRGRD
jgi:ubiquinone/menaquinone biosynthesis C-methylase UbiE